MKALANTLLALGVCIAFLSIGNTGLFGQLNWAKGPCKQAASPDGSDCWCHHVGTGKIGHYCGTQKTGKYCYNTDQTDCWQWNADPLLVCMGPKTICQNYPLCNAGCQTYQSEMCNYQQWDCGISGNPPMP